MAIEKPPGWGEVEVFAQFFGDDGAAHGGPFEYVECAEGGGYGMDVRETVAVG